jgi:hypothetical protein
MPETRHSHDFGWHDHQGGDMPHEHTLYDQVPAASNSRKARPRKTMIFFLVVALLILVVIVWANPHANIPVLSNIVCSVKGGSWYDGGILGPPGCYKP